MSTFDVVRPDVGGQTIAHVIRHLYGILFALERNNDQHRAEDLFLRDPHLAIGMEEKRRLDVVAWPGYRATTRCYTSTLIATDLKIAQHAPDVNRMDQRADLGLHIEWIAHPNMLDPLGQAG